MLDIIINTAAVTIFITVVIARFIHQFIVSELKDEHNFATFNLRKRITEQSLYSLQLLQRISKLEKENFQLTNKKPIEENQKSF